MKSFLKLLKNKSGSFFSACLIFPLWLFILIIMGVEINNHKKLEELVETNQIVSRLIATSTNYNEAINKVNGYIESLKTKQYYVLNNENSSYFTITSIDVCQEASGFETINNCSINEINSNQGYYWKRKNVVTYEITIYTGAHFSTSNQIKFGGHTYTLVNDSYTYSSSIFLCY